MQIKPLVVSIFLTTQCLLPASFALANNQCSAVFDSSSQTPFPISPKWRKTPGNLFSAVRANAAHNWAYFKKIQPHLMYLKEAFEVMGIGIGDFHILNVGDIELANGNRKIGLIDVDDGGRTSLFADFTRSVISNQVSPYKIPINDLWNAYVTGLAGKKMDKPKVVTHVLKQSHEDYLKLQKKYLDEMIDHKTFSAAAKVHPLTEADPLTQDVYENSHTAFEKVLGDVTILAQGFRVKETGGSQGIPRFWYLIKTKGEKSIIEFKTLAEPAMDTYQHQGTQKERIQELIEVYRPQKSTYGLYQFVDGGKYQFIARQRLKSFFSFDPEKIESDKDIKNGQDMYLYLANKMGLWHAELGVGAKIDLDLTNSEDNAFKEFEKIITDYIELMIKENN